MKNLIEKKEFEEKLGSKANLPDFTSFKSIINSKLEKIDSEINRIGERSTNRSDLKLMQEQNET